MQRLLGLLILGLACTIGFSTVGCSKKAEEKKGQTDEEKKAAAAKEEAEKAKKAAEEAAKKSAEADKKAEEAKKAAEESRKKLFSLEKLDAVEVEPGKKTDVTVKIARGEKSEDPVEIKIEKLPKGVTAEGGKIEKDKSEFKVTLDAGKDAEAGEATITATAGKQEYATPLKITVKKK